MSSCVRTGHGVKVKHLQMKGSVCLCVYCRFSMVCPEHVFSFLLINKGINILIVIIRHSRICAEASFPLPSFLTFCKGDAHHGPRNLLTAEVVPLAAEGSLTCCFARFLEIINSGYVSSIKGYCVTHSCVFSLPSPKKRLCSLALQELESEKKANPFSSYMYK